MSQQYTAAGSPPRPQAPPPSPEPSKTRQTHPERRGTGQVSSDVHAAVVGPHSERRRGGDSNRGAQPGAGSFGSDDGGCTTAASFAAVDKPVAEAPVVTIKVVTSRLQSLSAAAAPPPPLPRKLCTSSAASNGCANLVTGSNPMEDNAWGSGSLTPLQASPHKRAPGLINNGSLPATPSMTSSPTSPTLPHGPFLVASSPESEVSTEAEVQAGQRSNETEPRVMQAPGAAAAAQSLIVLFNPLQTAVPVATSSNSVHFNGFSLAEQLAGATPGADILAEAWGQAVAMVSASAGASALASITIVPSTTPHSTSTSQITQPPSSQASTQGSETITTAPLPAVRLGSRSRVTLSSARAVAPPARAIERVSSVSTGPIVHLNVGGTHLSTLRSTLCLAQDSHLANMFSDRWNDRLLRDETGRVFLDYDPTIFIVLLNFFRALSLDGGSGPLRDICVHPSQEKQLLLLVDYLQLQRYIPCRFEETFNPTLTSKHVSANGPAALRLNSGRKIDYAVAATTTSYFDMCVELILEVQCFAAAPHPPRVKKGTPEEPPGPHDTNAMFIGISTVTQLEVCDISSKKCTHLTSTFGWTTNRACTRRIECGAKCAIEGHRSFWCEGDCLRLTLDCRKTPPEGTARLQLHNYRTDTALTMEIQSCRLGGDPKWLCLVGLTTWGDEIRINNARRVGMRPSPL